MSIRVEIKIKRKPKINLPFLSLIALSKSRALSNPAFVIEVILAPVSKSKPAIKPINPEKMHMFLSNCPKTSSVMDPLL
jgi:hypothetical protein